MGTDGNRGVLLGELGDEVCRLRRTAENQAAALAHWRRCSDQDYLEKVRLVDGLRLALLALEQYRTFQTVTDRVREIIKEADVPISLLKPEEWETALNAIRSSDSLNLNSIRG